LALISREAADGKEPDLLVHFWRVAEQKSEAAERHLETNREALRHAADALTQAVFENQQLRARLARPVDHAIAIRPADD
jgi:uncharacterized membrane protein